jgi:hypothetical protein
LVTETADFLEVAVEQISSNNIALITQTVEALLEFAQGQFAGGPRRMRVPAGLALFPSLSIGASPRLTSLRRDQVPPKTSAPSSTPMWSTTST